jgi:LacI family transcriptional regulator
MPTVSRNRQAEQRRVLVVLDAAAAWSRGILMGFAALAKERNWTILHYHPTSNLTWLLEEWEPRVVVLPPAYAGVLPSRIRGRTLIAVNHDRSAEGIASVCLDERRIAQLAATHLLETGLRQFAVFRFERSPFAVAREEAFVAAVTASGGRVLPGWWSDDPALARQSEVGDELVKWLTGLPKPCGLFACTDSWTRVVARYCQVANLKIPEQLALVGVDNDVIDCEFAAPSLSSVAIPWRQMGASVAQLVARALDGENIAGCRLEVEPVDVVVRRSSEIFAVSDPVVRRAVEWIESQASTRFSVPKVAKSVGVTRQTLERRFRAVLGRTVLQEVRRAHLQLAKRLLASTTHELSRVAKESGFASSSQLSVVFSKELGMPPGTYRRRLRSLHRDVE